MRSEKVTQNGWRRILMISGPTFDIIQKSDDTHRFLPNDSTHDSYPTKLMLPQTDQLQKLANYESILRYLRLYLRSYGLFCIFLLASSLQSASLIDT